MELNKQPREKQFLDPNGSLDVVDVWPTIQGEGPFVGIPAVFVRLAGCQFQCSLCDTDYTTNRKQWDVVALEQRIAEFKHKLVVLTGGEPFRQNIGHLVRYLWEKDYRVQIETNGGLSIPDFPWRCCNVVVSPKSGKVHPDIRRHALAWKYVVEAGHVNERGLPTRVLGVGMQVAEPDPGSVVYIQPLDVQDVQENAKHVQQAVDICLKHNYGLCLQVHKLAGLR